MSISDYKKAYQTCQAKIKSYETKVHEIEMNFVKEYRELLVHWRADTYANNTTLNRLLRNDPFKEFDGDDENWENRDPQKEVDEEFHDKL